MPSPGIGRAGRIRVYNIGIGAAAVIPQGVHIEGLEGLPTHEALHSKAWDIWLKLEANAKKAAKTPAFVVSAQVGVDAFVVSTQHPDRGVLRMTVIMIEPD